MRAMTRGRRPKPTALRRIEGNPGRRPFNANEPVPPDGLPSCPEHLSIVAAAEWDRVAKTLYDMGVLTTIDRAALAAYCQAYARWVEAEEKLAETPALFKTPSGYVQQSPWMGIANKQLELMGRYMTELGMTPASRSRVAAESREAPRMEFVTIYEDEADAKKLLLEKLEAMAQRIAAAEQDPTADRE
jgi:P27 family predicted phage terminase small subunit